MIKQWFMAAAIAVGALGAPAAAQYISDGEGFVRAVRDRNGAKAIELLRLRKGTIINARDARGETALLVALARRDGAFTGYLIAQGADPNLPSSSGETPLLTAARMGFYDGVVRLLEAGAKIDGTNRKGETPLIIAVQQRNTQLVRLLLGNRADPDKTDSAAGYSARDYATRDSRSSEILRLINSRKPKPVIGAIR